MTTEFTILFSYNEKTYKAGVLKCTNEKDEIEYDVRPVHPFIVRKFGRQISIFRNKDQFNTHNHIARDYADFFNCLVHAIRIAGKQKTRGTKGTFLKNLGMK